ncbi:MAG: RnfABCDGE type electron transport complex subunit G [Clostridia bacterium]|nr:RnfABCDGE type electron transport complex subunit G [Clostridia bacterium]
MRDIVKQAVALFIICIVVSATLAFTYSVTREKIEDRARMDAEAARKEVLASAETFEKLEAPTQHNSALSQVKEAYKGMKANETKGYVFLVETKGYGGIMKITVGVGTKGEITGMKIGQNNETPGLGTKAAEAPFRTQLIGIRPSVPLKVIKVGKTKPEEVEAISGATITSRAVVEAVQAAIDMSVRLARGEGTAK